MPPILPLSPTPLKAQIYSQFLISVSFLVLPPWPLGREQFLRQRTSQTRGLSVWLKAKARKIKNDLWVFILLAPSQSLKITTFIKFFGEKERRQSINSNLMFLFSDLYIFKISACWCQGFLNNCDKTSIITS